MLRVIHAFDIRPGIVEESFIEWLDSSLWEICRRFGSLERKTWIFIDGIEGTYEKGKPARRPKYLNEAFWPSQKDADAFREWLMSDDGKDFRKRWFDGIINHTVLRYVDFRPRDTVGDE